jgi:hypothetical protein
MKKAKLVKEALKKPHLYSPEELSYFQLWLRARKKRKQQKDALIRATLEKVYLTE